MNHEKIESAVQKVVRYAESTGVCAKAKDIAVGRVYKPIGAVIIDGILQAGLKYKQVKPCVDKFLENYPNNKTLSDFIQAARKDSMEKVCNWRNHIKLCRIWMLAEFLREQKVDTVADFYKWGKSEANRDSLTNMHGIARKTRNYLMQLVGHSDIAAVDVRMRRFLKNAKVAAYFSDEEVERIITQAAKKCGVSPFQFDRAIWHNADSCGHCSNR